MTTEKPHLDENRVARLDRLGACNAAHPGLSHLLSGEASFADAIFRDDATRLHIVQAGGPVDAHSSDLGLILDALQATYDFVPIAAGANAAARSLAAASGLTLIFAEDRQTRAVLPGRAGPGGEIVEIAAQDFDPVLPTRFNAASTIRRPA